MSGSYTVIPGPTPSSLEGSTLGKKEYSFNIDFHYQKMLDSKSSEQQHTAISCVLKLYIDTLQDFTGLQKNI